MVFKWLKDYYLKFRYGFDKRPERLKLHGLLTIAPLKFKNDETHFKKAAVVDISSTGIAIESFEEFKVGDDIMMEFALPTHHVPVAGIIMRRHQKPPTWLYGIKYDVRLTPRHNIKQVLSYAKLEIKKLKKAPQTT